MNGKPFAPTAQLVTAQSAPPRQRRSGLPSPVSGLPHAKACSRLLPLVTRHSSHVTRHRAAGAFPHSPFTSHRAKRSPAPQAQLVTRHTSRVTAPQAHSHIHHSPFTIHRAKRSPAPQAHSSLVTRHASPRRRRIPTFTSHQSPREALPRATGALVTRHTSRVTAPQAHSHIHHSPFTARSAPPRHRRTRHSSLVTRHRAAGAFPHSPVTIHRAKRIPAPRRPSLVVSFSPRHSLFLPAPQAHSSLVTRHASPRRRRIPTFTIHQSPRQALPRAAGATRHSSHVTRHRAKRIPPLVSFSPRRRRNSSRVTRHASPRRRRIPTFTIHPSPRQAHPHTTPQPAQHYPPQHNTAAPVHCPTVADE